MTPLMPHRLAAATALLADHSPGPETPYLAWTVDGWGATLDPDAAFAFPSEVLARRYAAAILAAVGVTWVPVPADGAVSSVPAAGVHCRGCGCTATFACPRSCCWHEPDLCSECARPRELEIWTVYENPADYPGKFVARRSLSGIPTREVLVADTLDALRERGLAGRGVMARHAQDPVVVVETWM